MWDFQWKLLGNIVSLNLIFQTVVKQGRPFNQLPSPSFRSDENCPLCLEMMALFHDLAEKNKSKQTF